MALTVHESASETLLATFLADPGWAKLLQSWQEGFAEIDDDDLSPYGQPYLGIWPAHQQAAALYLHTMVLTGQIGWQVYHVGDGPAPDACRAENAAVLADLSPDLVIDVDLRQNCGDSDGRVAWSSPLAILRSTGELDNHGHIVTESTRFDRFSSWSAPLEIGSTLASRTLDHLIWSGAVARWPYDSDILLVFVNLGEMGPDRISRLVSETRQAKARRRA